IYPAVSLLDKTEELVEVVSASSIADFDFQAFDVKYRGFTQAFDNYLETAQFEGAGAQASITNTNLALADNYGAVAATGPQTLVSNLATELQERIQRIFSELLLGGYAKRNPGMEHKGGVERGGTLILLYTHSAFIKQVFNTNRETVGAKVMQARQIISPQGPAMTIADPRRVLSDVLQTTDPLDDFVVLADFCIPNMCCDTDCSDLEVEEPIREEPQPATVGGLISGQRSPTANPRPIADAQVGVVNVQSNQSVNVTRTEANYSFTAQPGTYRITVSAARFATQTRDVTLQSGETRTENFILQLEQIG
ncbi:MAG TPA: carboxypeptidase-like regulatory domain-containing protein, partial [Rhodothermales bacterium]